MKRPCSICAVPRVVNAKSRDPMICHSCRRNGHSTARSTEQRRSIDAARRRDLRARGLVLSPGNHRTRARKFDVEYHHVDRRRVFSRDRWKCGICGLTVDKRLKWPHPGSATLDHIVPMARGGGHTYANTQCAHWRCNHRKLAGGGGEQLALIG